MSNAITGFVIPAASIGLDALLIRPRRGFFPLGSVDNPGAATPILVPQVVVEEQHHHELEITEHPIEEGAPIADHAFKRPAIVRLRWHWSNSPTINSPLISAAVTFGGRAGGVLAAIPPTLGAIQTIGSILSGNAPNQVREIFESILALQESRIPFDLFTGKKAYTSMLIQSIAEETSDRSENALPLVITCRQVIIVQTSIVAAVGNPANMQNPASNGAPVDLGTLDFRDAGVTSLPDFA